MLEAIGAGVAPRIGDRDWKDVWMDSPECAVVKKEIESIKRHALAKPVIEKKAVSTCEYLCFSSGALLTHFLIDATSFWYQLRLVVERNNKALWRSPDYIFSRIFIASFVSLFISLSFLQLGHSVRDMQFRIFGM